MTSTPGVPPASLPTASSTLDHPPPSASPVPSGLPSTAPSTRAAPSSDRLAALAEEALRRRCEWIERSWHPGPRHIAKAEVLEFLNTARTSGPPAAEGSDAVARFVQPWVDSLLVRNAAEVEEERAAGVALLRLPEAADVASELRRFERALVDADYTAAVDSGVDPDPDYDESVEEEMAAAGLTPEQVDAQAAAWSAPSRCAMAAAAGLLQPGGTAALDGNALPSEVGCTSTGAAMPPPSSMASPPTLTATVSRRANASMRAPSTRGSGGFAVGGGGSGGGLSSIALKGPAQHVVACLCRLEDALRHHVLWRDAASVGGEAWEAALAAVEKVLLCKLGVSVFAAGKRAPRRDWYLTRRFRRLQFIDFKHLDLPTFPAWFESGWQLAQAALRHMNRYVAPGDKMACILNACRIVSTMLTLAEEVGGKGDGAVGADEFLPALIYTVIRANPGCMYSNAHYIAEYSRPGLMMSQAGYFFTNMLSAISFVRHARAEQLSLTPDEFAGMLAAATPSVTRAISGGDLLRLAAGSSGDAILPRAESEGSAVVEGGRDATDSPLTQHELEARLVAARHASYAACDAFWKACAVAEVVLAEDDMTTWLPPAAGSTHVPLDVVGADGRALST